MIAWPSLVNQWHAVVSVCRVGLSTRAAPARGPHRLDQRRVILDPPQPFRVKPDLLAVSEAALPILRRQSPGWTRALWTAGCYARYAPDRASPSCDGARLHIGADARLVPPGARPYEGMALAPLRCSSLKRSRNRLVFCARSMCLATSAGSCVSCARFWCRRSSLTSLWICQSSRVNSCHSRLRDRSAFPPVDIRRVNSDSALLV